MTTSTFSHTGSHTGVEHTSLHPVHAVRVFLTAWFRATPVYILYRALTH